MYHRCTRGLIASRQGSRRLGGYTIFCLSAFTLSRLRRLWFDPAGDPFGEEPPGAVGDGDAGTDRLELQVAMHRFGQVDGQALPLGRGVVIPLGQNLVGDLRPAGDVRGRGHGSGLGARAEEGLVAAHAANSSMLLTRAVMSVAAALAGSSSITVCPVAAEVANTM